MTIIDPHSHGTPTGPSGPILSSAQRHALRIAAVTWAIWAVVLLFLLPTLSFGGWIGGVLAPVAGLLMGALGGLGVGFQALAAIVSGALFPGFALGMASAIAGAFVAWMYRAFRVKNELARSFLATAFSPAVFEGDAVRFVCQIVLGALLGYVAGTGFFDVGIFVHTTDGFSELHNIFAGIGPGGSGGAGGTFLETLFWLFVMFVGLIAAGAVIGGCAGGCLGALFGYLWSTIGYATMFDASQGAAVRFLSYYRPETGYGKRGLVVMSGALIGIGEGMLVGAGTGAVMFLLQWLAY